MSSIESVYFDIPTGTGLLQKGEKLHGIFDVPAATGTPVVESFKEAGDWIDVHLSSGHKISLPESRIGYIVERDPA